MESTLYYHPLFQGAPPALIGPILQEPPLRDTQYAKGQPIAHQGQPCRNLLLLTEGSAYARMTSNDGRELTLETLSAPEVLASPFLFSTQGTYPVTIIADSACHIRPLGRERVERLLAASPTVRQNLLRIISDHTVFLNSRISEFAFQTLATRIVAYITRHGPLTNLQQAAYIMGVARPSLSRAVSQLVRRSILCRQANGYTLANK